MSTLSEARKDAEKYARAQMFYGEGAGTERKLIKASVESKSLVKPGYAEEFHRALAQQDMAKHAKQAKHRRTRKDAFYSLDRTSRAIRSGRYENMQTGALVLIGVGYVLYTSGAGRVIYDKTLDTSRDLRRRMKSRKRLRTVTNLDSFRTL